MRRMRRALARAGGAGIRRTRFEGREHLVVPVVALVEGVLLGMGQDAPELALADEFGQYPEAWNGIPLVLGHPTERGSPVSANSPDVIEQRSVGRFFNAHLDGRKLKGELWIDVQKARTLGAEAAEVLRRLESGGRLEVSTGYWAETEAVDGTYRGERYAAIQRNLRPDHLALLPNDVGACSWEDGCGAPRQNRRGGMKRMNWLTKRLMKRRMARYNRGRHPVERSRRNRRRSRRRNETNIEELLATALAEVVGSEVQILEVTDEAVRFSAEGSTFEADYRIDEDGNITFGDVREVSDEDDLATEREGDEGTTEGNGDDIEEAAEEVADDLDEVDETAEEVADLIDDLDEVIDELVEAAGDAGGEVAELVEELDEIIEEAIEASGDLEDAVDELEDAIEDLGDAVEDVTDVDLEGMRRRKVRRNRKPRERRQRVNRRDRRGRRNNTRRSAEEYIAAVKDPEVREVLAGGLRTQRAYRAQLLTALTANSRCAFSKRELEGMGTPMLEKLASSISEDSYIGMGGPRTNTGSDMPAPPPVVLAQRKEAK